MFCYVFWLCTILFILAKYSYFYNHSIDIFTIFICLRISLHGPIGNKYVNSNVYIQISMLLKQ